MADGSIGVLPGDMSNATPAPAPSPAPVVRRRSTLSANPEPVIEPEDASAPVADTGPGTAGAAPVAAPTAPETTAEAAPAPSPAPALRRRTMLSNTDGPASPEASETDLGGGTPEQAAPAAASSDPTGAAPAAAATSGGSAPAAGPTVAQIVDPPQAPRGADGELVVTDEMRRRLDGEGGASASAAAPGEDPAAATAPGVAPADAPVPGADGASPGAPDADAEDRFREPDPIDAVHAMLIGGLSLMRRDRREDVNDEIEQLAARRAAVEARINAMFAQAQNRGGGRPSLLGSLASKISGNPAKGAMRDIEEIDRQLAERKTYRRIVVDRRMGRTIEAADTMYKAHLELNRRVEGFNAAFGASDVGKQYLSDLQSVADAKNVPVEAVRARIHDRGDTDPEISALRDRADAMLRDPVAGKAMGEIETLSRMVRNNADQLRSGIEKAAESGVSPEPLAKDFENALKSIKGRDCALARPGGEPVDDSQNRMKEIMESVMKTVREALDRIMSMFRGPGR